MGKVFCHAFAEAGADIVVAELNPQTGTETAASIQETGRRALYVRPTFAPSAAWRLWSSATLAEFGRVDFLMNNAGITKWCEAEHVSEAGLAGRDRHQPQRPLSTAARPWPCT